MYPKTLRRRKRLFRKTSRWNPNVALALIGVALAAFVFVDARWFMDLASEPAHAPARRAVTPSPAPAARQRPALPQASLAELKDARTQYAVAAEAMDAAWNGVGADRAKALADDQRAWAAQTTAACKDAAGKPGDDIARTAAARLKCEASARQARATWLQSAAGQAVATPAPVAATPEPTQPPPAEPVAQTTPVSTAPATPEAAPSTTPAVLTAREACDLIRARTGRVGEQVSFRGEYVRDHSGWTLIRPVGCDQGAGVEVIEPSALRRIDQAGPPAGSSPNRRLIAQFTATLVHGGQDESDLDHESGVRLSISGVRYVKVVEPAAATKPPAPATRTPTTRADCSLCGEDDVVDSLIRRHHSVSQ